MLANPNLRQLALPAALFLLNIACAIGCFAHGDTKRGIYWIASAVCIASVTL